MTIRTLRYLTVILFATALAFTGLGTQINVANALAQPAGGQNPPGPPQGGGPFNTDGRDDKPASEVFKNITQFKNLPAGRLGGIMQNWTRVLGVKCNYCHTPGQWEKEDLPTKQIAREMVQMTMKINNEALKEIKNLKSEKPSVSCYTCHRGQAKPETAMPPSPQPPPPPPAPPKP